MVSPATSSPTGREGLHGAHLRTLEAVFHHPVAHNLEWGNVVGLMEKIGTVHEKANNRFAFEVGGETHLMHKPHTKDLTSTEVVDLRHFLQRAGWSPGAPSQAPAHTDPAPPSVMVVLDHHGAKLYHIDLTSGASTGAELRPYDPHHFLHHLAHKDQSREQGQRAPEDPDYYRRIAAAVAHAGRIVIVGHGVGKSNAALHLSEFLRSHHPETYARVVRQIDTDLSATTTPQLQQLARQALGIPAP
jgi:hypothetical protein